MITRPRRLPKPELKLGKGWPRTFNNAVEELSIVSELTFRTGIRVQRWKSFFRKEKKPEKERRRRTVQ